MLVNTQTHVYYAIQLKDTGDRKLFLKKRELNDSEGEIFRYTYTSDVTEALSINPYNPAYKSETSRINGKIVKIKRVSDVYIEDFK